VAQSNSSNAFDVNSTRSERFYGGYTWLILKNLIGWTLILASLVAGPLIPGPGGIPLFLVGFALVSFPGKRKLTARILRGRRIALRGRAVLFTILASSLALPALPLWFFESRVDWLAAPWVKRPLYLSAGYLVGVFAAGLATFAAVLVINLVMRIMPLIRRRVRPWLRHHHVRLLPPRYRRRLPHETGIGPVQFKGEILAFIRKRQRRKPHPHKHG